MNIKDREAVEKLKKLLLEKIPLIEMRVFGSRARKDGDEYSDLDIFLELESLDNDQKETVHHLTWEVGLDYGIVISPLLFSREEVEESPLKDSPILVNIIQEGIIV